MCVCVYFVLCVLCVKIHFYLRGANRRLPGLGAAVCGPFGGCGCDQKLGDVDRCVVCVCVCVCVCVRVNI